MMFNLALLLGDCTVSTRSSAPHAVREKSPFTVAAPDAPATVRKSTASLPIDNWFWGPLLRKWNALSPVLSETVASEETLVATIKFEWCVPAAVMFNKAELFSP